MDSLINKEETVYFKVWFEIRIQNALNEILIIILIRIGLKSKVYFSTSHHHNIMEEITFVTGNKKKLEEVIAILGTSIPFTLKSEKLDLPELQGEPEDVAKEKCKAAVEKLGCACIVEDTSLCFNALGGLPGIYIKWFLEKTGHVGLNNLLLAYADKSAYAQCIFAYSPGPGHEPLTFVGRTNGTIVEARGPLDFG